VLVEGRRVEAPLGRDVENGVLVGKLELVPVAVQVVRVRAELPAETREVEVGLREARRDRTSVQPSGRCRLTRKLWPHLGYSN
jgi:hypothetical protein